MGQTPRARRDRFRRTRTAQRACCNAMASLQSSTRLLQALKVKLRYLSMLIPTRQACQRPPGARFFLHQRRKNRGRKTPLRAGGGPPALRTHPCIPRRGCSRTLYGVPGRFVGASVPCELVSKPLAASLLLTGCCGDLQATVVGGPQHRTVVTLRAGACSGVVSGGAALRGCAPKPIRCTAPQGCWGFVAAHWPKAPPSGALLVCASHWVHSEPSVLGTDGG